MCVAGHCFEYNYEYEGEMKPSRFWVAAIGALAVLGVAALAVSWAARQQPVSFTRQVEDRGRYYRLKVDLHYRGTPVHFDIVVGIGTRITTYKDGGRSMGPVALAPFAYGLRMPDNKAVVVRLPELWKGETTANGGVTPDMIPFIAVFSDADRPVEGLGYGTEDAYDSPISELKFGKAEVLTATKEEWEAWRATEAGKNIIKTEMLTWTLGVGGSHKPLAPGKVYFGGDCRAAIRHHLSDEAREIMTPFWREQGSEYWLQTTEAGEAWAKVRSRGYKDLPKHPFEYGNFDMLALRLTPARTAAVEANSRSLYRRLPREVYPLRDRFPAHRSTTWELPPSIIETAASGAVPLDGVTVWDVDVRPEMRGFFSCSKSGQNLERLNERRLQRYVRINGSLVKKPLGWATGTLYVTLERADYRYEQATISLINHFGGL